MARIPHFARPFQVIDGKVASVEQNSPEEIRDCVISCLKTRRGSLIDFPDFGIPNELFSRQTPNASPDVYLRAIEESEPRASLLATAEIEGLVRRTVFREES